MGRQRAPAAGEARHDVHPREADRRSSRADATAEVLMVCSPPKCLLRKPGICVAGPAVPVVLGSSLSFARPPRRVGKVASRVLRPDPLKRYTAEKIWCQGNHNSPASRRPRFANYSPPTAFPLLYFLGRFPSRSSLARPPPSFPHCHTRMDIVGERYRRG